MEPAAAEFEELMLCGFCKQKYNDTDQSPKLLSCKHYFCLQCMRTSLSKGQELYCVHCWKRTELGELGPESLPTYAPVLCLAKNFSQMKLAPPPQPPSQPSAQVKQDKAKVSENCHTHAMPLALWCQTCCCSLCRACAATSEHASHHVRSQNETKEQLAAELQMDLQSMNKMLGEVQRLAVQQREFLLKILEACVTLKTHVEADLTNNASHIELTDVRDLLSKLRMNLSVVETLSEVQNLYTTLNVEKQRMQLRYQEMYLQCQLDDLIRNSTVVFDFQLLKQALTNIQNGEVAYPGNSRLAATQQNPILFLANYCMSQLYSRHVLAKQINGNVDYHHQHHNHQNYLNLNVNFPQAAQAVQQKCAAYAGDAVMAHSPQVRNPGGACPLYYFNVEVNGAPMGRVVRTQNG